MGMLRAGSVHVAGIPVALNISAEGLVISPADSSDPNSVKAAAVAHWLPPPISHTQVPMLVLPPRSSAICSL